MSILKPKKVKLTELFYDLVFFILNKYDNISN